MLNRILCIFLFVEFCLAEGLQAQTALKAAFASSAQAENDLALNITATTCRRR